MIEALDKRYESNPLASQIATITAAYSKRYSNGYNMATYCDEFVSLFTTLERMEKSAAIADSHKAPILLASLGHSSQYEALVSAMMLCTADEISWDTLRADLIQEYHRINRPKTSCGQSEGHIRGNNWNRRDSRHDHVKTAANGADYRGRGAGGPYVIQLVTTAASMDMPFNIASSIRTAPGAPYPPRAVKPTKACLPLKLAALPSQLLRNA